VFAAFYTAWCTYKWFILVIFRQVWYVSVTVMLAHSAFYYADVQYIFNYVLLQWCYILVCLVGFEGSNCEVNIDDCVQASCPDNKVCVDGVNSYDCRCRQGFMGDDCTTSINFCEDNPCQNNASCANTYGNYTCICPVGISGESFVTALLLSLTHSCMKEAWKTADTKGCHVTWPWVSFIQFTSSHIP
jgi:hypothetical protein